MKSLVFVTIIIICVQFKIRQNEKAVYLFTNNVKHAYNSKGLDSIEVNYTLEEDYFKQLLKQLPSKLKNDDLERLKSNYVQIDRDSVKYKNKIFYSSIVSDTNLNQHIKIIHDELGIIYVLRLNIYDFLYLVELDGELTNDVLDFIVDNTALIAPITPNIPMD